MSQVLSGKEASQYYKSLLKKQLDNYQQFKPILAIVIPKVDASSRSYLLSRKKLAQELGIEVQTYIYESINQNDLSELIKKLNDDNQVNGIIVDRPFPAQIDEQSIYDMINPSKDVDGCGVINAGLLMLAKEAIYPSTAQGVIALLDYYKITISGKNIVVVGRSKIVGMPVAKMLIDRHATVTVCHSRTQNLAGICKSADILIIAIGKKKMINQDYVSPSTIIIDVGIHYDEVDGLCGDVDPCVYQLVQAYSPVPGGVGPLTSVMLMNNLIKFLK